MNIIKLFLDLVIHKETDVTREQAETERKKRDNEVCEDFKKSVNEIIKRNCRFDDSAMIELETRAIREKREELAQYYRKELGYDVVLVDKKVLGEGTEKAFLFISW